MVEEGKNISFELQKKSGAIHAKETEGRQKQ